VLAGGDTEVAGVDAARALLAAAGAERPTAVVCFNDRCAVGLRDGLLAGGVGVPGEVSVVGYDDSPLARLGTVDLTSVSQDPTALSEATVALVVRLLDGGTAPAGDVVVDPRLVVRRSTAPPPAGTSRPSITHPEKM
jgi:DNA-binding LacI/PurR family transcriptional regulator